MNRPNRKSRRKTRRNPRGGKAAEAQKGKARQKPRRQPVEEVEDDEENEQPRRRFPFGCLIVLIILALGFMGNMVQSNSIGDAFHNAFGLNRLAVGVVVAAIAAFIFLGGVQRIAAVTEKVVPIMAAFYILGCIAILVINAKALPGALAQVFVLAFEPQAMAGGIAGVTVQQSMRFGVARGLFSNEAGMGSTPHAHALAKVKNPEDQGMVAMISVFIDTFVVLTLTALVILSSGMLQPGVDGAPQGTQLAQAAFSSAFGSFGNIFVAICMLFFAFSTIIGWYFFGEVNFKAMFGTKAVKVYAVIVVICVMIGSLLKVNLVWNLSDLFKRADGFPQPDRAAGALWRRGKGLPGSRPAAPRGKGGDKRQRSILICSSKPRKRSHSRCGVFLLSCTYSFGLL